MISINSKPQRRFAAAFAALTLLGASSAQAGDVRLFVLAPQPPASLNTVETQGSDKPAYAHSYNIPYATVEQQIRNEIKKANVDIGGSVKCSGACPDVHWHVNVSTDFSFTQKDQPTITPFGNPQDNGVDIQLKSQFKLHTVISARVWADPVTGHVEGKVDVPVDLLIGTQVASKLDLWPDTKSVSSYCEATKLQETACVTLTLDGKNIDLSDAKGAAVAIGTALGGLIGGSPLAAGIGDPLSGMLVGALVSNEAAKIAEQKVQEEANKALTAVLQVASIRATWLASNYLDAKVAQVNNVKSKLLDTKLPGLNKSLGELAPAFGLSLDVQTVKSSGDINVIVTPRFAANPAGGKLVGKLRMPKEACTYMDTDIGTFPMGLVTVNADLAGKVGTPCSTLIPGGDFKTSAYLGADPKVLKVGANPLPNWKAGGTVALSGNMTVYSHGTAAPVRQRGGLHSFTPTGYYECSIEISGLPSADILEMVLKGKAAERMPGYFQDPYRYVEVTAGGTSAALDNEWKVLNPPIIFGGEGACGAGHVKVPHYQAEGWQDRVTDLFDPNKCANCDIKLEQGMLKIRNSKPVLENPALKPLFDALRQGKALPAAVQAPATQAPATQQTPQAPAGKQLAPALRQQIQRPGVQKETPK